MNAGPVRVASATPAHFHFADAVVRYGQPPNGHRVRSHNFRLSYRAVCLRVMEGGSMGDYRACGFDDAAAVQGAQERAESMALDDFDVSNVHLFENDTHWPYFERLRREAPVHYCRDSHHGAYWSLTRFDDIKRVDADHELFS